MNDTMNKPLSLHFMAGWSVTGLNLLIYKLLESMYPEQASSWLGMLLIAAMITLGFYLETAKIQAIKIFRLVGLGAVAYSVGTIVMGIVLVPADSPAFTIVYFAAVLAPVTALLAIWTLRQAFLEQVKRYAEWR